jgi:hypothetical protein
MKLPRLLLLIGSAALAASLAVAAPPEGKGKPAKAHQGGKPAAQSGDGYSGATDTDYGKQKKNKGKAWEDHDRDGRVDLDDAFLSGIVGQGTYGRYDALPPGIRKNLARGKPLPPGLQSRAVPDDLLHRLPRREGYEWRAYGEDLVLYSVTGRVVEEVIEGIFR